MVRRYDKDVRRALERGAIANSVRAAKKLVGNMDPVKVEKHRADALARMNARVRARVSAAGPHGDDRLLKFQTFDIAAGRPADARARIAPFNKPLLEVDDPVVRANVGTAIDACYALRATGETKRFELLLGKAEAYLASRSPEVRRNLYPWETFESLVLGGRIDEALDEAERVVASGSYPTPWIKTDWAMNAVADQPRWQALMTRVRAELRVQRDRLAAESKSMP